MKTVHEYQARTPEEHARLQKKLQAKKAQKKRRRLPPFDDLMQPVHARAFLALAIICNDIAHGARVTRADILRRLPYHAGTTTNLGQSLHLMNAAFCFDDEQPPDAMAEEAYLPADPGTTYPFLLSRVEQRYLRTMLDAPEAAFLLADDLRGKLRAALQDVPPFDLSFIERSQLAGDDVTDVETGRALRTVFRCLCERRALVLPYGRCLLPLRLRYNFRTNRYSLVALSEDADAPVRYHLDALHGARLGKSSPDPAKLEAQYQSYLDAHRVTVRLRLSDRRNARERCYALFASFDKTSCYLEKEAAYLIELSYYDFDRADVLARILSLGADVTVLAGEGNAEAAALRAAVLQCLKGALPYYKEET